MSCASLYPLTALYTFAIEIRRYYYAKQTLPHFTVALACCIIFLKLFALGAILLSCFLAKTFIGIRYIHTYLYHSTHVLFMKRRKLLDALSCIACDPSILSGQ